MYRPVFEPGSCCFYQVGSILEISGQTYGDTNIGCYCSTK
jgi:hypothetical protein